jgi:hypothetical protein
LEFGRGQSGGFIRGGRSDQGPDPCPFLLARWGIEAII